ncbi:MAG: hypothetical protein R6U43_10665 [Candidatus Krumholzibacteriales bacterium]
MVIAGPRNLSRNQDDTGSGEDRRIELAEQELSRYRRILDTAVLLAGSEFIKPLSSIKGYLGLIRGGSEDQGSTQSRNGHYLSRAEEAIYELEQLIYLYMQLLRSSRGRLEPGDIRRINVSDFIDEVTARYCSEEKVIRNSVDRKLCEISVQRNPLSVVLGNIFSSVARTGSGTVCAEVTSRVWSESGDSAEGYLIVDIICTDGSDTGWAGDGREESSARIDEPGLLLARNIIEIMGGGLEISSVRGTGATLSLSFPAILEI